MYHAIFILKKKETKIEKVEFLLLLTHVCNNIYLFISVFIFGQIFKLSSQKSELVNLTYPKVWLVEKKKHIQNLWRVSF